MSEFLTTVYSTLFELAANSIRYKVLLIVLVAILFLFVLSLFFSLFTVYLRYLNDKKSRCYFRLEKKWYPLILEFINDEVEKEMVF